MKEQDIAAIYSFCRYAPLGRGPTEFDCWGLVLDVRRRLGLPLPLDPMQAARRPGEMRAIVGRHLSAGDWRPAEPAAGAIAMFPSLARCLHAGVWISGGVLDFSQMAGLRWRSAATVESLKMELIEWAR